MADHIESIEIAPDIYRSRWNVRINDYAVNSVARDFETLLVDFSTNRASTIEKQVKPIETRVRARNARLSDLGQLLSDLSRIQQELAGDEHEASAEGKLKDDLVPIMNSLDSTVLSGSAITKSNCEKAIQLVKTEIDRLNNESQSDMNTLQSLVDKRDESFSTASSIMQAVSDCRSTAIRNIQ